ncbi:MAG: hypothetical protein ACTSX9_02250 [Candidatus Njordarchaeales archaeon]
MSLAPREKKLYFFDSDSLIVINNLSISKLTIFRMRTFLLDLLRELGEDVHALYTLIQETISIALRLLPLKKKYSSTLYELSLATLWLVLRERGINKYTLYRLVETAKKKMKKRILMKRLLLILSDIRYIFRELDAKDEIKKVVMKTLPKLFKHPSMMQRTVKILGEKAPAYIRLLRLSIFRILNSLNVQDVSGKSRTVLSAICIYAADKVACKELNIRPLISAKMLEDLLGISQFTVLRHYKKYLCKLR